MNSHRALLVLVVLASFAFYAQAIKLPSNFGNSLYKKCDALDSSTSVLLTMAIRYTHDNATLRVEQASRFYYGLNCTGFYFYSELSNYYLRFVRDFSTVNTSLIEYNTISSKAYSFNGDGRLALEAQCGGNGSPCCTVPKLDGEPVSVLTCITGPCGGSPLQYDAFKLNSDGSWQWGSEKAPCTADVVVEGYDPNPFTRQQALHSYDSSSDASPLMPTLMAAVFVSVSLIVALF